jgi:hypothetical protein
MAQRKKRNNDLKRAIRTRMAATGENYTTARRHLIASRNTASQSASTVAQPQPDTGLHQLVGGALETLERISPQTLDKVRAADQLTVSQYEAGEESDLGHDVLCDFVSETLLPAIMTAELAAARSLDLTAEDGTDPAADTLDTLTCLRETLEGDARGHVSETLCGQCGHPVCEDPAGSEGVWVHDAAALGNEAYDLNEDHAALPPEETL